MPKCCTPLYNMTRFCPHMTNAGRSDMNERSPTLIAALRALPAGLVIDVGADNGQDAIDFAMAGHRVWSFEPAPGKGEKIKNRLRANGVAERVQVHSVALSNYSGIAHFAVHKSLPKHDGLTAQQHPGAQRAKNSGVQQVEVPVRRLDSFAAADTRISFLKIDAQGMDFRVLKGALGLLSGGSVERLVFEFTPELMPGGPEEAVEHLRWMRTVGYACAPCNSIWSRAPAFRQGEKVDVAKYVAAYLDPRRSNRHRGYENIVCLPASRCTNCDVLVS